MTALQVFADDFLTERDPYRPGQRARIVDAQPVSVTVAHVLLDCSKEREAFAPLIEKVDVAGYVMVGDKSASGAEV